MAYNKQTWSARTGAGLNRFVDGDGNYITLTSMPSEIITEGTPFTAARMNHMEDGIEIVNTKYDVPLRVVGQSVATTAFVADTTYTDYPYRAAVAVTGALSTMLPEVVFGLTDAISGILAPVVESYDGGVYIYASEVPAAAVTIATLTLWKAV